MSWIALIDITFFDTQRLTLSRPPRKAPPVPGFNGLHLFGIEISDIIYQYFSLE